MAAIRTVSYRRTLGRMNLAVKHCRESGDYLLAAHFLNCKTALEEFITLGVLKNDPRRNGPFLCFDQGEV